MRLDRLPHGRHGLSRQDVLASQRGRMLEAIAVTVSSKGYAATTIADVAAAAKVSRRNVRRALRRQGAVLPGGVRTPGSATCYREMARAARHAGDWRDRLQARVRTMLSVLAADPAFTRIGTVEVAERRPGGARAPRRDDARLRAPVPASPRHGPEGRPHDREARRERVRGARRRRDRAGRDPRRGRADERAAGLEPVLMQFLTAGLAGPVSGNAGGAG